MYQRGAEKISETYEDIPENYQDLIKEEDFEKEGIENIRGKIYGGDPNLIFAEIKMIIPFVCFSFTIRTVLKNNLIASVFKWYAYTFDIVFKIVMIHILHHFKRSFSSSFTNLLILIIFPHLRHSHNPDSLLIRKVSLFPRRQNGHCLSTKKESVWI
jgi:hypothetical protein